MANLARTPAEVIAGEAVYGSLQERFNDMVHIASVIANRAAKTGKTIKSVVSAPKQFSAYGRAMPPGTKALVSLAERALAMVEQNGPITPATYYSTPKARTSLPKGLKDVGTTTGHVYSVDPQERAIATAEGYVRPGTALPAQGPVPVARPKVDVGPNINRVGAIPGFRRASITVPSRTFTPPDRPMPSGPVSGTLGKGLAALAPNGLRDLPARAQPAVSMDMGPKRPNAPNRRITDLARAAVNETVGMGPGYKMSVISGQEDPGNQYGSNRHKTGLAADLNVYDPTGRKMNVVQDRQKMMDLAQTMAAMGATGIGIGSNYMGATGIHADLTQPGPGQASTWGSLGKKYRGQLESAMKFAEMPASYYDAKMPAKTAILGLPRPATPAYETQQRTALAAALEKAGIRGIGATTQVAPVEKVTRQALAPDRAMPSGAVRSSTPALTAALEKKGIATSSFPSRPAAIAPNTTRSTTPPSSTAQSTTAPSQYAGRPASVAARVASPTSMGSTVGIPGRTVAETVSPARDPRDMQNVAGPKGTFSVTPALDRALHQAGIASPTPSPSVTSPAPTRVAPVVSQPVAPVATQPRVVRQVQQPPQPVQAVQAPAPDALSQGSFDARFQGVTPGLRASDIYGGQVGSAMSTGGNVVSRATPYGGTTVTNKYGATTATTPDGRQAATGNPFGGMSPNTRSIIGGIAGAALGALAGGPAGSLAGGLLGRQVATKGIGGIGGGSAPGSGGGQAGGGGLRSLFGGGTVGNARGGNNQQGGGSQGAGIGGGGGRGQRRGGQGN